MPACITSQAIEDMGTIVFGLIAFVYFWIDTPNRKTAAVLRFAGKMASKPSLTPTVDSMTLHFAQH